MDASLRQSWNEVLGDRGAATALADQAFADVCSRYTEPGRFYHTLEHIRDVLATVHRLAGYTRNLRSVALAAWLHDVIYDSKASDNEERSAEYAVELCERLGLAEGPHVASLIMKTKTHDSGDDADARVLLDADLAVLGAGPAVYQAYAANIRREYAWVPEEAYRTGRRQVLERFLARPAIFHLLNDLEKPARRNIAEEIAALQ